MKLPLPNRTVIAAVGGAFLGFGVANALVGRSPSRPAGLGDGLDAGVPSGVELDGLLGDFELEMLLKVLDDVEFEERLDGELEVS